MIQNLCHIGLHGRIHCDISSVTLQAFHSKSSANYLHKLFCACKGKLSTKVCAAITSKDLRCSASISSPGNDKKVVWKHAVPRVPGK